MRLGLFLKQAYLFLLLVLRMAVFGFVGVFRERAQGRVFGLLALVAVRG